MVWCGPGHGFMQWWSFEDILFFDWIWRTTNSDLEEQFWELYRRQIIKFHIKIIIDSIYMMELKRFVKHDFNSL